MTEHGVDTSHAEADLAAQAAAITDYHNTQADLHQFDYALSDDALGRLRFCESTNNYGAIGGGGAYRGAYQFSRQTWDGVANSAFPAYAGVDPATAPPTPRTPSPAPCTCSADVPPGQCAVPRSRMRLHPSRSE